MDTREEIKITLPAGGPEDYWQVSPGAAVPSRFSADWSGRSYGAASGVDIEIYDGHPSIVQVRFFDDYEPIKKLDLLPDCLVASMHACHPPPEVSWLESDAFHGPEEFHVVRSPVTEQARMEFDLTEAQRAARELARNRTSDRKLATAVRVLEESSSQEEAARKLNIDPKQFQVLMDKADQRGMRRRKRNTVRLNGRWISKKRCIERAKAGELPALYSLGLLPPASPQRAMLFRGWPTPQKRHMALLDDPELSWVREKYGSPPPRLRIPRPCLDLPGFSEFLAQWKDEYVEYYGQEPPEPEVLDSSDLDFSELLEPDPPPF